MFLGELQPVVKELDIFSDYRLRVVQIIRDYGMYERAQAPQESRARHDKH
jgi:hypothetical protein